MAELLGWGWLFQGAALFAGERTGKGFVKPTKQELQRFFKLAKLVGAEVLKHLLHIVAAGFLNALKSLVARCRQCHLHHAPVVGIAHARHQAIFYQTVYNARQRPGRLLGDIGKFAHAACACLADGKQGYHLRHGQVNVRAAQRLE
jgi:hypothetical protein